MLLWNNKKKIDSSTRHNDDDNNNNIGRGPEVYERSAAAINRKLQDSFSPVDLQYAYNYCFAFATGRPRQLKFSSEMSGGHDIFSGCYNQR